MPSDRSQGDNSDPPAASTDPSAAATNSSPGLNNRIEAFYAQLKRIARNSMRKQRRNHTLQSTELVAEAYVRLSKLDNLEIENEHRFLALVARTMRTILIDHARGKQAKCRQPPGERLLLDELAEELEVSFANTVELEEAMEQLSRVQSRAAEIVDLHFFAGLTIQDIATLMDVHAKTVRRDWEFARAFLLMQLSP